jgi:hypothetical protein
VPTEVEGRRQDRWLPAGVVDRLVLVAGVEHRSQIPNLKRWKQAISSSVWVDLTAVDGAGGQVMLRN